MKKLIVVILFILSLATPCLAMSVGGPDMTVPEESKFLKDQAIKKALDRLEYNMNIKASVDADIIFKRELTSAPADTTEAEIEGHNFMVSFHDVIEPYIKVGTSNLRVNWTQHGESIEVETDPGFVWGAGVKAKVWGNDYGTKLTLDFQYRNITLDFEKATIGGSTAGTNSDNFDIKDWQTSLLLSKKYIKPIGASDFYVVPYTGLTYSSLEADVNFTDATNGLLYSTYDASDENVFGFVLGCDVMPFYLSHYLLNLELRLINETALTLGGTLKF